MAVNTYTYKYRCERTEELLKSWVDKQSHNKCWFYPEIFRELCSLHRVYPSLPDLLPSQEEFKEGCDKYRRELYANIQM